MLYIYFLKQSAVFVAYDLLVVAVDLDTGLSHTQPETDMFVLSIFIL